MSVITRQPVPIGFELLVIKNNAIEERHQAGMIPTIRVPFFHKGGVKLILVDVRDRFEELRFQNDLFTRDQALLDLTFVVHYRVKDIERIALRVRDPLGQLFARTKACLVDVTLRTTIEDCLNHGTRLFIEGSKPLVKDLEEIGLHFIRAEVTNFKLPDRARDQYAKVMGQGREKMLEIDTLRQMKEQGVLDDYMKLKMLEGLSQANFSPAHILAMQMMGGLQAGVPPPFPPAPPPALPVNPAAGALPPGAGAPEAPTTFRSGIDVIDEKGTIIRRVETTRPRLVNLATERIHVLEKEVISAGRKADCDIVLSDEYASRRHADFMVNQQGGVLLLNVSSAAAITVNGRTTVPPGERCPLRHGDEVEIGYTRFRLLLE